LEHETKLCTHDLSAMNISVNKGVNTMMGGGMIGGNSFGGFGMFGLIGMILNLIITVGVIVGIVWLVIWLARRSGSNGLATFGPVSTVQPPREILQARYARGEITQEQYQEILADLS
jgi:putative membrane protein